MCKNLPVLNLPNEEDDLILEKNASNEYWSAVLKIKEESSSNIAMEALTKVNAIIQQGKRKSLQS